MPVQRIEFVVKPDGTVTEAVSGVVGDACAELTSKIEQRLGEVTHREHKPEYYNQQHTDTTASGWQSTSGASPTGGDFR